MKQEACWEATASVCVREDGGFFIFAFIKYIVIAHYWDLFFFVNSYIIRGRAQCLIHLCILRSGTEKIGTILVE